MSTAQTRNQRIEKLHKTARKLHAPIAPPSNRTLLEHLIYACCLEDSTYDAADDVFARLQVNYYDWNEIRVTTTAELAELMKPLYDPQAAATRVRKSLQGMFETHYSFDIDLLKKENVGKAQEVILKYRGVTPFVLAYVTQHALGGHAIPLDQAFLQLLYVVGIISEEERAQGKATGLERAIPKNKGIEFASATHQLAVAFLASPFNTNLRKTLTQIAPDAADRFPKRGGKTKEVTTAITESPAEPTPKPKGSKTPSKPAKPAADKRPSGREVNAKRPTGKAKTPEKSKAKSPMVKLTKRKPK